MSLTNIEKETILLFNEAEPNIEIYTHNKRLMNRVRKFYSEHPNEVIEIRDEGDAVTATLIKKRVWINIVSKIHSDNLSQRAYTNKLWENSRSWQDSKALASTSPKNRGVTTGFHTSPLQMDAEPTNSFKGADTHGNPTASEDF